MDSTCPERSPSEACSFIASGTPQLTELTPISMLLSLNSLKVERSKVQKQTSDPKPLICSPSHMEFKLQKPIERRPHTRVARRCKKYTSRPTTTAQLSLPTSKPDNIKKVYVQKACINCKSSHVACDTSRPCLRCVRKGKSSSCIDASRKKRGRPRVKQASSTDDSDTSVDTPTKPSLLGLPRSDNEGRLPRIYDDPSAYGKTSLRAILLYPSDLDRK